jgi:hypothetical protein
LFLILDGSSPLDRFIYQYTLLYINMVEKRVFLVFLSLFILVIFSLSVYAIPLISFTSPTPDNGTSQIATFATLNVSITESDMEEFVFNWNDENYTYYNDSLILMMNLDNLSSLGENDTLIYDVTGNGYNGTAYGDASPVTSGKYGGAFEFDGTNDYISTGYVGGVKTLSFWINTRDLNKYHSQFAQRDIMAYSPHGTEEAGEWQMHWGGFNPSNANKLRIYAYDSNGDGGEMVTTSTFQVNTWYHVVVTSDGSNVKYYIDGDFDSQHSWDVVLGAADNTEELYVGGCGSNGDIWSFNGTIDEVRVWNRVLSSTEVSEIYKGNLRKTSTNSWEFISNQTSLSVGVYNYTAYAMDSSLAINSTEMRFLYIIDSVPEFSFYAIIFVLVLVAGGFFKVKKKHS